MQHNIKKYILTQEGLNNLKNEYDELTRIKRPQIAKRIQRAREFGDLSENSEYDAAKEEQSLLEARIAQLETVLPKAQIIEQVTTTDFVVIGSKVVVEIEGQRDEFSIVGSMEANPAKKKISNESPVGAAMLGAKVGEVVDVVTPIICAQYKILEIK
ncbi:transcription elongation factor GreA [Candidatus Curtissbacteria bacterium RBG_13_35_7]|uniref:Transcription elongation factor GreA n=1 Tax=Candidatus Curtissbacteria bacterium RBG_13_35_7 TaxID=1797705 RepID=A0A1F5G4L7_9BACT|nr:MAG: transcription elongation factor GreA [Candidatus Curtissbacteria bacterium RBG_13_35_7]